jgi:hypothetical protein
MTVSSQPHPPINYGVGAEEETSRATDARTAWRIWAILVTAIGFIYLLMYNPYWVPGGDSELYVAAGRSWATGLRHTFNGQFVSICPPGWPLIHAAAMKISPTFGFLKLLTLLCMTAAMGLWYWFLLRYTTPKMSALITLLCAIVSHCYSLSFWMHSDALFCLISTAAMVVACQINERKSGMAWRILVLVALCAAMQLVRWAGVLQWVVIAGVLLAGQPIPINRARITELVGHLRSGPWIGLALSFAVTFGTFLIVRNALKLTKEEALAAQDAGATFDEQQQPQPPMEARTVDIFNGKQSQKMTFAQEMTKRVKESGKWFSWLLWPEFRFLGGSGVKGILNSIDTIVGWLLIGALVIAGWVGLGKRQWVWLGLGAYCVCLCLNWPNPNARYMVPLLPLILWGMMQGIRIFFASFGKLRLGTQLVTVMLFSIAVANTSLLAVDIYVARSRDFYARYEGGLDESLISCVRYLNNRNIDDGELAVSEVYNNLGKRKLSKFGLRATVMLSNRIVRNVPGKWDIDDVAKGKFINWARSRHIKWYLCQQPISPWRVWHFRLPGWLQAKLSHEEVGPESAGWVLFRYVAPVNLIMPLPSPHVVTIAPAKFVKVDVTTSHDWPTRVPGM